MAFLIPASPQRSERISRSSGCFSPGKTLIRISLGLMLVVFCQSVQTARAQTLKEYEVKAAFILNFCRYIEWPPKSFASPESPLVLGILGKDNFGGFLDDLLQNQNSHNRPIRVRRITSEESVSGCHLVFVSEPDRKHLSEVFRRATPSSVLTIGETPDFAATGGCINFVLEGKKIRFEINVDAVRASQLKMKSELLNVAKIVRRG